MMRRGQIHEVKIGKHTIGQNRPVFMIAEIGINHNGDLERAKKLVRAAQQAGAHAVKFQSFKADKICDRHLEETKDVEGITGGTKSSYELYKALELTDKMHRELNKIAKKEKIMLLSSVFDEETADFLDDLGVPAFKIASSDLTHLPLIQHTASKGKPIIISTGMGTISEIEEALQACYAVGNDQIILLHCISCYPPAHEDVNLNTIQTMQGHFPHPVGYSDHCEGTLPCFAACCMGSLVIEKHFTLDNKWQGPDHRISATAREFADLVYNVKMLEKMRGSGIKMPAQSELKVRKSSRRSVRALGTIKAGEVITQNSVIALKPEIGLAPKELDNIIGKRARVALKHHEPITWDKLE